MREIPTGIDFGKIIMNKEGLKRLDKKDLDLEAEREAYQIEVNNAAGSKLATEGKDILNSQLIGEEMAKKIHGDALEENLHRAQTAKAKATFKEIRKEGLYNEVGRAEAEVNKARKLKQQGEEE